MDNDLVSVSEQRFSRSMSKPVSGAGDEDMSLLAGVRKRRRRSLFLPRIQRGLRDGRCGCHKGPRDYPKAYSYSCCKKSSTLHGRVVLFERILVWFVELITHKGSRAEGHPGRSCRYRENSEPCSHAAPERRANHNHRALRHQSGASRSTSEITTTQRCRRYSLGRMLVSRRNTCAKWLAVEKPRSTEIVAILCFVSRRSRRAAFMRAMS